MLQIPKRQLLKLQQNKLHVPLKFPIQNRNPNSDKYINAKMVTNYLSTKDKLFLCKQ